MKRGDATYKPSRPRDPTTVKAVCWCEQTFVQIPADWPALGLTASCRNPACNPPTGNEPTP